MLMNTLPKTVVRPFVITEVRARVNTKLRTDTLVSRNIVGVGLLIKDWVVRQGPLALNTTHPVQELSRGVVHVELVERAKLRTQLQTGVGE